MLYNKKNSFYKEINYYSEFIVVTIYNLKNAEQYMEELQKEDIKYNVNRYIDCYLNEEDYTEIYEIIIRYSENKEKDLWSL